MYGKHSSKREAVLRRPFVEQTSFSQSDAKAEINYGTLIKKLSALNTS